MRLALTVILPLLLPSIIYFAYVSLARESGPQPVQAVPWFWLIAGGLILAVMAVVLLSRLEGAEPGSIYHPPHEVDGQIEPGYFGPKDEKPSK